MEQARHLRLHHPDHPGETDVHNNINLDNESDRIMLRRYRMLLNTESAASMTLLCNPTAEMLSSSESLAEHIIRELAPYRSPNIIKRAFE